MVKSKKPYVPHPKIAQLAIEQLSSSNGEAATPKALIDPSYVRAFRFLQGHSEKIEDLTGYLRCVSDDLQLLFGFQKPMPAGIRFACHFLELLADSIVRKNENAEVPGVRLEVIRAREGVPSDDHDKWLDDLQTAWLYNQLYETHGSYQKTIQHMREQLGYHKNTVDIARRRIGLEKPTRPKRKGKRVKA